MCSLLKINKIYYDIFSNFLYSQLQKLWWQHVWPCLQQEMRTAEVLAAVLQPALTLVHESTPIEYETIILPTFR